MSRLLIVSGFLGSGKTTLISALLQSGLLGTRVVVVENDFGSAAFDAELLAQSDVYVDELVSGCVCCSLAGDLCASLAAVEKSRHPQRIVLEPSGIARLSDVLAALDGVTDELGVIVDAVICLAAPLGWGPGRTHWFGIYKNQIENASLVVPSQVDRLAEAERQDFLERLQRWAGDVPVWTGEDWRASDLASLLRLAAREGTSLARNLGAAFKGADVRWECLTLRLPAPVNPYGCLAVLEQLQKKSECFGNVFRAKGFITDAGGTTWKLDLTPSGSSAGPVPVICQSSVSIIGSSLARARIGTWLRDSLSKMCAC